MVDPDVWDSAHRHRLAQHQSRSFSGASPVGYETTTSNSMSNWLLDLVLDLPSLIWFLIWRLIFTVGILFALWMIIRALVKYIRRIWPSVRQWLTASIYKPRRAIVRAGRKTYYSIRYAEIWDRLYLKWQRFANFFWDHWLKVVFLAAGFIICYKLAKPILPPALGGLVKLRSESLSEAAVMGYDVPVWARSAAQRQQSGWAGTGHATKEYADVVDAPETIESWPHFSEDPVIHTAFDNSFEAAIVTERAESPQEALYEISDDHGAVSTVSETTTVSEMETVTVTEAISASQDTQKTVQSIFTLTEMTTLTQPTIIANITPTTMILLSTVYGLDTTTVYAEKVITETLVEGRPLNPDTTTVYVEKKIAQSHLPSATTVYAEQTITKTPTEGSLFKMPNESPPLATATTVYAQETITETLTEEIRVEIPYELSYLPNTTTVYAETTITETLTEGPRLEMPQEPSSPDRQRENIGSTMTWCHECRQHHCCEVLH